MEQKSQALRQKLSDYRRVFYAISSMLPVSADVADRFSDHYSTPVDVERTIREIQDGMNLAFAQRQDAARQPLNVCRERTLRFMVAMGSCDEHP